MMGDPNFRHTILYLSHHSAEDGALGFIINRPLGKSIADLAADGLEKLPHVPVYEGGPVSRNQVILATLKWDAENGMCAFEPMSEPAGEVELPPDDHEPLRVFLGYAGWAKNQLESEIAQNAWLVMRPHPDLINGPIDEDTWRQLMIGLGPMYQVLADAPEDATNN